MYLEMTRKTGSKFDKDFVPGKNLYMWVLAFDHVQNRDSRHPRPMRSSLSLSRGLMPEPQARLIKGSRPETAAASGGRYNNSGELQAGTKR